MDHSENKITYSKLMLPEEKAAQIAVNLGFVEEGNRWFVYRIPRLSLMHKSLFEIAKMQVYMPMCQRGPRKDGKQRVSYVPKLGYYLFVLATSEQVESFRVLNLINPVYTHRCEGEILPKDKVWMTVEAPEMHQLMLVVEGMEQEVEFTTPDSQKLKKGDRVRVIGGKFKGLEGILLSNQGSHKGGRICVNVTNRLVAKTAYIRDEYIQVLEFSRHNNHFFRKLQAIEKLFDEIILNWVDEGKLPTNEQRAALQFFLIRYAQLEGLTHVNNVKLVVSRYVANVLLSRRQEAKLLLDAFLKQVMSNKKLKRAHLRYPTAQQYIDMWLAKVAPVANIAS